VKVEILEEAGYHQALYSLSLSHKRREVPIEEWWTLERMNRMKKLLPKLAHRGASHAKVLRQIVLWVDIEAPRFWWSEFDTYKIGTVAHSESTMHTLSKRDLHWSDLENGARFNVDFQPLIDQFNKFRKQGTSIEVLKSFLPEAYLQRRVVMMNYQVLRTIIAQRSNHRLPQWHEFIHTIENQVEHPELLENIRYE